MRSASTIARLDEIDMVHRGLTGVVRVAGADRLVNRPVLRQQLLTRAGQIVNQEPVLEYAIRQQPIAGAQRMQEDDVVRALADRAVEFDVDGCLPRKVAVPMRRLHSLHDLIEQRKIVAGRPSRGIFSGDALYLAAVLHVVGSSLPVCCDQVHHRL